MRPGTRSSSNRRRERCGSTIRTSGQILSVDAEGTVERVVDLSDPHIVPTRLALDPAGGVFVGTLTTVPFPDGTAQVMHVGTDGTVEVVWTGLTTVVDVAVGADGTLYALELSTGNLAEPPFFTPMSGRIVRQTGPDTSEPVHEGLMFPIAMEIAPDGSFYVSLPAIGANDGSGSIVSLAGDAPEGTAPAASEPMATEPMATGAATECAPIEGTTGTMPAPPASAPASAPACAPAALLPQRPQALQRAHRQAHRPPLQRAHRHQARRSRSLTSPSDPPSSPWPPERR